MRVMRTTIDLPDDLHRVAKALAHDRRQTLSEAVAEIMRRGIGAKHPLNFSVDPNTGLPIVRGGPLVTSEDVRSLEDDE